MATLSFWEARAAVLNRLKDAPLPPIETVQLAAADGRILAETIRADRDLPPADRSLRDGFAIRAADAPGELTVVGEVRAGEPAIHAVGPGEAVEIMTGAPLPEGADAVVMVEHVTRAGNRIRVDRAVSPGEHRTPRGAEARAGDALLEAGLRLGYCEVAVLATVGRSEVRVYKKPRVAIVPTGDEVVELSDRPVDHQVRNSNAWSLAAQVRQAGGEPVPVGIARDNHASTRELVERSLECDLVLLSGGVSAGKYDIVESVVASLGAEFYFDRVLIQPGQPAVFGRVRNTYFFGLPGNPASTMVTFEIFARAALERLAGLREPRLPLTLARLSRPFRHKPGLTRFLPAVLAANGLEVSPVEWKGSGDVPALARANCYLVAQPDKEAWEAGELITVLLR